MANPGTTITPQQQMLSTVSNVIKRLAGSLYHKGMPSI
jgi:hypothetical protein